MKKIYIFYENRDSWINRLSKNYSFELLNQLSNFLLNSEKINFLIENLQQIIRNDLKINTIEIGNFKDFNKKIDYNTRILFWNITDGTGIYKGSYIPSYAKLLDYSFYGSETYTQYISQDKYKFILICNGLNIPTPSTMLVYKNSNNDIIINNSDNSFESKYYFVKPNNFDNNIGITEHSKCNSVNKAKVIALDLYEKYNSPILIQKFIEGVDIRVSFIDIDKNQKPIYKRINEIDGKLGIYFVKKTSPNNDTLEFITENHININETFEKINNNKLITKITIYIKRLIINLKIKDYFAIDIKLDINGNLYFIEINTAPFIIGERFGKYTEDIYNKKLDETMVLSLQRYF